LSSLHVDQLIIRHVGPIDLRVGAGECVCIEGTSGSGKTLLLRAIADLDPHQGTVSADGVACTAMPAPEWRRKVALLVAESQWWGERIGEHFDDGVDPAWMERLALPAAALDWDVARCSTGERQRLALLRMLARHPTVLLLDEPTGNLDEDSTQRVESLLAEYRRQHHAAVLWVSHDSRQVARVAQRGLTLHDGKLLRKEAM
jgi:putative ABC transport system ATP-binding protein